METQKLQPHELVAFNTATASENKIHDDAVAASLGFGSGLVPGVDVYAYLCQPPIEFWGRRFLDTGRAEVRFDAPVHDGETVRVDAELVDGELSAVIHSPNGTPASLAASIRSGSIDVPETEPHPRPGARQPASPSTLLPDRPLGSLDVCCDEDEARRYLGLIRDETSATAALGCVHPGWLLRLANNILSGNVVLGPWIHVGSTIENLAAVAIGEPLTVEGCTTAEYEHKGHRFVELQVVIRGADRSPRSLIRHTAIYEPRQVRELTS